MKKTPHRWSPWMFFGLFLIVLFVYGLCQSIRTQRYLHLGDQLAQAAIPFERTMVNPSLRILMVGDSTGLGVGASRPEATMAGLVGAKYPEAEVINQSVSGSTTHDVLLQLQKVSGSYDVILIHVGINDIVQFKPYDALTADVRDLLDLALSKGKNVLLTTGGNVGDALSYTPIVRLIYTWRSLAVREIFLQQVAASTGEIRYTDLYREPAQDPFVQNPQKYFSADLFHPSDAGYQVWFNVMSAELDQFHLSEGN